MKHSINFATASVVACVFVLGCGGSNSQTAKTPDAVVMQVAKAVENNQPQAVFKALPASYQSDINSVIADATKKIDSEIWNEVQTLLKQVLKISKAKKSLILETRMLASNPKKKELSASWDQGIEMFETVINSDFADINKLRKGDVASLLAGSGAKIMKQVKAANVDNSDYKEMKESLDKLKSIKASVESQDGDTAKVKIEADGETSETVDFVRIEGKWIPKDMADSFAAKITEARAKIAKIDFTSEEGKAAKAKIMQQIGMAKTMIVQAEAAKTSAELEGVMMGVMMGAMSMGGGAGGPGAMPPPPSK